MVEPMKLLDNWRKLGRKKEEEKKKEKEVRSR
jgi:hypothetical protein